MLNFRKLNWTMVHWKAERGVKFVFTNSSEYYVKKIIWIFYLFIEDTIDHSWHHNSRSSGEEGTKGYAIKTWGLYRFIWSEIRYKPYRNERLSDESQFVIFLPEMVEQQRKPDNQGCWPDNDGQSNQGQIFFAGKRRHQKFCSLNYFPYKDEIHWKNEKY